MHYAYQACKGTQLIEFAEFCGPDKAFAPQPA